MNPKDKIRLQHMVDACDEAIGFCAGLSEQQFVEDSRTWRAVVNCVEVIGEAACHVSDELKVETPHISWHEIVRMRHRLVHVYFDIDTTLLLGRGSEGFAVFGGVSASPT